MTVIRRWECPKDSEVAGWWKGPGGRLVLHCGRCDTPMVQVEYVPASQLQGAVEALQFYADPATWDHISARGTVTTNTPAARDNGERARRALGGQ